MRLLPLFSLWKERELNLEKTGFKYDDIITEENPTVQEALKRLSPREYYDRTYRNRRAVHQASGCIYISLSLVDENINVAGVGYSIPATSTTTNRKGSGRKEIVGQWSLIKK